MRAARARLLRAGPIDGQVEGYWIPGWAPTPARPPTYAPSGAVLPRLTAEGTRAPLRTPGSIRPVTCLDLIEVDGVWTPLSEAGLYTYAHTTGLARKEAWRFVRFEGARRETYEALPAGLVEADDLQRLYGDIASARARRDAPALELRLRRVAAPR